MTTHHYPTVDALAIRSLPAGEQSRIWLNLATDGLGQPICAPVIVVRGVREGPVFGISACLHGNELNGIPVIHNVINRIDPLRLRGTVVAMVVANIPGFHRHQREFSEGSDLNHIMPGTPNGTRVQVYAHRLVTRFVNHLDYFVDLHTASFGRANSLYIRADLSEARSARMAYLMRPRIIVHNPPSDRTLRGTAMERGAAAITVEIGDPQKLQPKFVRSTVIGIRKLLADAKMVQRRQTPPVPAPSLCSRSYWLYTEHGGILSNLPELAEMVEKGQPIAQVHDIFGNLIHEYVAPEAGIVIGRSIDPVACTGDRILHLGIVVDSVEDLKFQPRPD